MAAKPNPQDAIRVVSGGPGSGKSSFARIFAAQLAHVGDLKVLFVPLHLIDASKELVDEVGRFVRDEGILTQNPLDPTSPEMNLLIIFDGLDELASQGKIAVETARAFVREVDRMVEKQNLHEMRLRVLISGRELVIQENESEFRRPRQILTLLPYFVPASFETGRHFVREDEQYHDPNKLLKDDLRQQWWKKYGALTGNGFKALPKELSRSDLDEITSQPLLNYLVALSYTRGKLDFKKDINLNSIYGDLIAAVHERGYEKHRPFAPIRHMNLEDFFRVLEEIGLASWHGDSRTITVREIEESCRASGVGGLLDTFQEGAKVGVTRLLAAFFFRQYGQRDSGDPTFVFTHKSFGEYLTARRVVRAVDKMIRELERRDVSLDEGWDERDALKHWAQICGPSSISRYLYVFLMNEMNLRPTSRLKLWQGFLAKLFNSILRNGMPMEQLQIGRFKEILFQSRNAEEALLVALNICAQLNQQVITIDQQKQTAFGEWFKRIQGQRSGPESVLAAECLSFLDFSKATLYFDDFYGANLNSSILHLINASGANFVRASLIRTNLERANLHGSNLSLARLTEANLKGAHLHGANLQGANLGGANLEKADLEAANLKNANLVGANLNGANLEKADLEAANLKNANLVGANLNGANLEKADLVGANLKKTHVLTKSRLKTKNSKT